jgi:hypothetical protein
MPLRGEELYRAFRHAPEEKMNALLEAELRKTSQAHCTAYKARVDAFERQKAPYREVMQSLLKDNPVMQRLDSNVPTRPKPPVLSTKDLSFPRAPSQRYIKRGSMNLVDLPPFVGMVGGYSTGNASMVIAEPFSDLENGVGGFLGGAGGNNASGSGEGGSASAMFGIGQNFSPPRPSDICEQTSGLLWFSASPFWWIQTCEYYSNFATASLDLWVALQILEVSADGDTIISTPLTIEQTQQTVVSDSEWNIQSLGYWPNVSGVNVLAAPPIQVTSPFNYACFVFCGMDTSGSGSNSWTAVGGGMRLGSIDLVFDTFS